MSMATQPNRAQAALAEYRTACDRIRQDLARALKDRFVDDGEVVDTSDNVIQLFRSRIPDLHAERDIDNILADDFDWPLDREWRRLTDAFR
jgi:hypothetical protein